MIIHNEKVISCHPNRSLLVFVLTLSNPPSTQLLDNNNNNKICQHLIPKIDYFSNESQSNILNEMTMNFNIGEHLLLIGNQGTGKFIFINDKVGFSRTSHIEILTTFSRFFFVVNNKFKEKTS